MTTGDVASSLFQSFLLRMVHNTFTDEMGPALVGVYDTVASVPLMAITKLMKKGSSAWFDNVATPAMETMNDIVRLSLDESLSELRKTYGGEIKEWRWGSIHQVQFRHVFSEHSLLRPIFTVGPFPMAGSHSTINKGDYSLRNPFANTVGASTRQVFDLSDVNNTWSVTPPGQSGQVFQRHYDDQVHLWLNGLYRRQTMDRTAIERSGYHLLTLQPRR
jgi:penicillin amidase